MESIIIEAVEQDLEDAAKTAGERAYRYDRRYKVFQYTIIVLSSLATVFVWLATFTALPGFKFPAVITSAIVTILVGCLKTFGYQEKAKDYYSLQKELDYEPLLYKAGAGIYAQAKTTEERAKLFVQTGTQLLKDKWITPMKLRSPSTDFKTTFPASSVLSPQSRRHGFKISSDLDEVESVLNQNAVPVVQMQPDQQAVVVRNPLSDPYASTFTQEHTIAPQVVEVEPAHNQDVQQVVIPRPSQQVVVTRNPSFDPNTNIVTPEYPSTPRVVVRRSPDFGNSQEG